MTAEGQQLLMFGVGALRGPRSGTDLSSSAFLSGASGHDCGKATHIEHLGSRPSARVADMADAE
jgi:hypothetical protein